LFILLFIPLTSTDFIITSLSLYFFTILMFNNTYHVLMHIIYNQFPLICIFDYQLIVKYTY